MCKSRKSGKNKKTHKEKTKNKNIRANKIILNVNITALKLNITPHIFAQLKLFHRLKPEM